MHKLPRAAFFAVLALSALFLSSAASFGKNPIHLPATRTSIRSGAWNSALTWENGVVPSSGDSVVIAEGTTVTLGSDESVGTGSVTVRAGAVLDVGSAFLTANTLTAENGSEIRQGGSTGSPRNSVTFYNLAPDSTFTYKGSITSLAGTHPTYGNLKIALVSSSSSLTVGTSLNAVGKLILDIALPRELRFQSGSSSFGGLEILRGICVVNNSSSGTSTLNIAGDITVSSQGILRGTNANGHAKINLGGNFVNSGSMEEDDGSSTGDFTVSFNGQTRQSISGQSPVSFESLIINNEAGVLLDRDAAVQKNLTLTKGWIDAQLNSLVFGCNSSVVGAADDRFVRGYVTKDLCVPGAFTFPVGTANGFSPVGANVTSVVQPASLSVSAFDGAGTGVDPARSVSRFWNVIEEGELTADLKFFYRGADVSTPLDEANFSLVKKEGNAAPAVVCTGAGCIDPAAHTASINGVSNFSLWSIGIPLAPSAGEASLLGRVTRSDGRGIANAFVTATASDGRSSRIRTNQFGFFRFLDLTAGETYVIRVEAKRFQFDEPVRTITLNDALTEIHFIAGERRSMSAAPPSIRERRRTRF